MTISPARRAAFEILRRVEEERAYAAVLLASLDAGIREDDRALCHELVLGALRNQLWLDHAIGHFAQRKIEKIDLPVKIALRLALYQLRFLSRIPASAAVNESVNLVRVAGLKSAASFANAVLRRASRESDYDPALDARDEAEKISIETSHPRWLIDRWTEAIGRNEAAELAHANNRPPPLAFRFTAKSIGSEIELLNELRDGGALVTPSSIAPHAWRLSRVNESVRRLLLDGRIYFQDEASQLIAHLLYAEAGHCVLDVCAAPGSKATQLAAIAPETKIVAGDLYEHRARTMNELADRQGAALSVLACDASGSLPFPPGRFDRVLVDAPCSGTGTLRHNPEIRWQLTPPDLRELADKQRRILLNAAALVKPRGRLVYSTCSLEPEENEAVVNAFLGDQPDFEARPIEEFRGLLTLDGTIRTWPHRDDTDGFFVAAFSRK